jgi:hypothetical protein
MKKGLSITGLFLLMVIFGSAVFGQESAERLRQMQLANQADAAAKAGGNSAAKIEASKGNNTLPPGVTNATQMVAEQYRASGALKPYQPVNQPNANTDLSVSSPTSTKLVKKAGDPAATTPADKPQGVKNLKGNNSTAALASQLPTNFPTTSGNNSGATNAAAKGTNANPTNSQYDKVPYLSPSSKYNPAPTTGTNNGAYGSLQTIPQNQTSKSIYGTAPKTNSGQQGNNQYSAPPAALRQSGPAGNNGYTKAPPPAATGQSGQALPTGNNGYSKAPPPASAGQSGQALPSGNNGYSKAPPPAAAGQSARSVPAAATQNAGAGANPKVVNTPEKGGAVKVPPKPAPPGKRN